MLVEFLGNDLSKIANALDKLILNTPKGAPITAKEIEANIGISKDYNVFELQKALSFKNTEKVYRIINHFNANAKAHPMVVTIGSLYTYFAKIYKVHSLPSPKKKSIATLLRVHEFFADEYIAAARNYPRWKVEQVFKLLLEYDLKNKGLDSNADEGELMKELAFRILH